MTRDEFHATKKKPFVQSQLEEELAATQIILKWLLMERGEPVFVPGMVFETGVGGEIEVEQVASQGVVVRLVPAPTEA